MLDQVGDSYAHVKNYKVLPCSLPIVGPRADPGVLAVNTLPAGDFLKSSLSGRLPLLSARLAVTFPAEECHCPLTSTKLYYLVTEAHSCLLYTSDAADE